MTRSIVYSRVAARPRRVITADLEAEVQRRILHHSQQQIARDLGIAQSTVYRVLRRRNAVSALQSPSDRR